MTLHPRESRPPARSAGASSLDLAQVLRGGALRAVYQPIVDLETREPVAFEALVRGPVGSRLASPGALFHAARDEGVLRELDWACRVAAIEGALAAGYGRHRPLFVNVEPSILGGPAPPSAVPSVERAERELDLVVEFTERGFLRRPGELIAASARIRRRGWGIAIDDVGPDPASIALLPVIDPDIIKLELSLFSGEASAHQVVQLSAVLAQAERGEALILAEGIESEHQARRALGLGATLGQGWLFGRPGRLPSLPGRGAWDPGRWRRRRRQAEATPVDAVFGVRQPRRATKADLLGFSRHLEDWALATIDPTVVLSTFQRSERLGPLTRERYERLARRCLLVAVGGAGMEPEPATGVRGWDLPPGDLLLPQWNVVVLGSQVACALVATDLGDDGPDERRRFDYVLTFDRGLVVRAAQSLLARVRPMS